MGCSEASYTDSANAIGLQMQLESGTRHRALPVNKMEELSGYDVNGRWPGDGQAGSVAGCSGQKGHIPPHASQQGRVKILVGSAAAIQQDMPRLTI